MRASTARLTNSPVASRISISAGEPAYSSYALAFIHLDNLLAYAKRDRDGRIDGYSGRTCPTSAYAVSYREG